MSMTLLLIVVGCLVEGGQLVLCLTFLRSLAAYHTVRTAHGIPFVGGYRWLWEPQADAALDVLRQRVWYRTLFFVSWVVAGHTTFIAVALSALVMRER